MSAEWTIRPCADELPHMSHVVYRGDRTVGIPPVVCHGVRPYPTGREDERITFDQAGVYEIRGGSDGLTVTRVGGLIQLPTCPRCGNPPQFALPGQFFCGTDGCAVLSWNPYDTIEEFEATAQEVTILRAGDDG